jgi:DNA-binding response OmpR family regulator
MRIAVLDNDRHQADMIRQELAKGAHTCRTLQNAKDLFAHLEHEGCDMLVMDWQTADSNAHQLLHAVRDVLPPHAPVLVLANRSSQDDIIAALAAGANDYLIKPIRRSELLARVQIALKRAYPETQTTEQTRFGSYTFESTTCRVTKAGTTIEVTQKEFELALLFFHHLGRPLSRAYILDAIWSRDTDVPSRTIDTHVSRVRSKLELRPENGFRLAPVYSYGYRLEQLAP